MASMKYLLDEMRTLNQKRDDGVPRIKLSCGHTTVDEDAEDLLSGILWLFHSIIDGKVPVVSEEEVRGEVNYLWHTEESKWAVRAPKRLWDEAKKQKESMG